MNTLSKDQSVGPFKSPTEEAAEEWAGYTRAPLPSKTVNDQNVIVTAHQIVQGYVPFQRTTIAALLEMIERLRGELDAANQHVKILQETVQSFSPETEVGRNHDPSGADRLGLRPDLRAQDQQLSENRSVTQKDNNK